MLDVALDDESCQALVLLGIDGVLYDTEDVETRQNRLRKINIL